MGFHLKFFAATVTLLLLNTIAMVRSTPDTAVTSVLCNSGIYTSGDPFATSLAYVLEELETNTPTSKNYDYYNISPYPNAFAYGHGSCNKNSTSDCRSCIGAAKKAMLDSCQRRIGARAVLHDCSIRYEQYPFTD